MGTYIVAKQKVVFKQRKNKNNLNCSQHLVCATNLYHV